MFERSDNVKPVASQSAMVAIMKDDDVAERFAAGLRGLGYRVSNDVVLNQVWCRSGDQSARVR